MYMGVVNLGYATSFFMPSILSQLGWTSTRAQIMSIPIYVAGTVSCLVAALLSDRLKHRYSFTMAGVLVATIGLVMLMEQKALSTPLRYFALFLVLSGGYITQPITIGWLSNSMGGHHKRAVSSAVQIGFGNLGGIVASNIFLDRQKPTYTIGYGVSLGMLWMCGIACTVFAIGLRLENRKRDRHERDYRYELPQEELTNLGDDHPEFRFGY
jgi:sugar phosphate permease